MSDSIDLSEKLAAFSEHWSPRTVAQFNDCDIMVVKVQGESSGTSTTKPMIFSWC
jgi:hypothetical protein